MRSLAGIVCALLLSGCVADGPAPAPSDATTSAGQDEPPRKGGFRTLEHSNTGNADMDGTPVRRLIGSRADWDSFWAAYAANRDPQPAAPNVDFTREFVVVVTQGLRSTAGHNVTIGGFEWDASGANQVTVRFTETSPGPNCQSAAVQTHPIHAVAAARAQAVAPQAVFEPAQKTQEC